MRTRAFSAILIASAVLAACSETGSPTSRSGKPSAELSSPSGKSVSSSPSGPSSLGSGGMPPEPSESTGTADVTHALCFNRKATMTGTSGADRFGGTRDRDVIVTLGGDDVVENLGEDDWVCTGAGDDKVRLARSSLVRSVDLGAGDDRLRFAEATEIDGGPGDDRIVVDQGVGNISGGPGDDYLRSLTTKMPHGYPENTPCLTYRDSRRPVHVDLEGGEAHGEGHDTVVDFHCVYGSRHGDVIIGTPTRDGANGGRGHDLLRMGAGDDGVDGGLQADRVHLGPGNDYGNGSSGWDRLYGEDGSDSLEGWSDGDYLDGGTGNDQLYAALFCAIGGNSYDTAGLMDDAGNELFGGPGDDYLVGDKGNDRLDGGPGYDQAQPGYRDGRADWIASTERLIDGCLTRVELGKAFTPHG